MRVFHWLFSLFQQAFMSFYTWWLHWLWDVDGTATATVTSNMVLFRTLQKTRWRYECVKINFILHCFVARWQHWRIGQSARCCICRCWYHYSSNHSRCYGCFQCCKQYTNFAYNVLNPFSPVQLMLDKIIALDKSLVATSLIYDSFFFQQHASRYSNQLYTFAHHFHCLYLSYAKGTEVRPYAWLWYFYPPSILTMIGITSVCLCILFSTFMPDYPFSMAFTADMMYILVFVLKPAKNHNKL